MDAEIIAQIVRYLRANTVRAGAGIVLQQGTNGVLVSVAESRSKSPKIELRISPEHPFRVTDASSEEDGPQVTIRFGQVNSITPTIDDTPLDEIPAPKLAVVSGVIYLKVTTDEEGAVEAVEIESDETLPVASETEGYLTLATVTVADGAVTAINQSVMHSLQCLFCGGKHIFGGL